MIDFSIHVEMDGGGIPHRDKIAILRAQLTLLRTRAEQGIPVTVDALARTEQFARSLESEELPA